MNIMGMGRITIGLYNSYDSTKFREPHRRAIARAGGLAMSFNMNLALIGFPFPEDLSTPLELAKWVAGTTSIGSHGDYFVDLAEKGRFHSFPYPSKGFPPQLGEAVLTTSKPNPKKAVNVRQVADMVSHGQSILLVFGLGPHGVPKAPSEIPKYNLDITGGSYSLETCTAVGSVTGALHALLYQ
ncbi:MAG: DUF531 domain-containing protein [Candidatus Methanomethylophilaceae archaeon]|nr:DUF531 domain-containing protein [Thermoplasmata archaeon]MBQ2762530.1 DUF531 domain-containing protein [Candidatus Methanomethylophilaceae archaeon]